MVKSGSSQLIDKFRVHPSITAPSKLTNLLGVSSQGLGGELESQIRLGWSKRCLGLLRVWLGDVRGRGVQN